MGPKRLRILADDHGNIREERVEGGVRARGDALGGREGNARSSPLPPTEPVGADPAADFVVQPPGTLAEPARVQETMRWSPARESADEMHTTLMLAAWRI